MDDEADQATPDTTTAARSEQRASAPSHGSTTYRLTVENDAQAELGESVREVLRHNVFLQVTATPYALLLQNISSPLRPSFSKLLIPGVGYTGGEFFFSEAQFVSSPPAPPLIYVDESETQALESGAATAPKGLTEAIAFFLISSAAHACQNRLTEPGGYKFLCHTSPKTLEHSKLSRLIRDAVDSMMASGQPHPALRAAYDELCRSVTKPPAYEEALKLVIARFPQRKVLTVNATGSSLDFGSWANFMIGGNILGRGLTIDNLLVTYYLRRAKTTQMDTMLQHARMYGYRERLMPFTRVFLPPTLANRFRRIHEAETSLRELLSDPNTRAKVPVKVVNQLRLTRPPVLDIGCISAYRPGTQHYPTQPCFSASDLGNSTERIKGIVEKACPRALPTTNGDFLPVPIDAMCQLINNVRTLDEEKGGEWDPELLVRVLKLIGPDYDNSGLLSVREMKRTGPELPSGTLSGEEQAAARQTGKPVLFMMRDDGATTRGWAGLPFWHPTVVFPKDMANWVFNISA